MLSSLPLYRCSDIDQYLDGLGGDMKVERERGRWVGGAVTESGVSLDSRSVSHIEHATAPGTLVSMGGRRLGGAPKPPDAPPTKRRWEGHAWEAKAQEMVGRCRMSTLPIGNPDRHRAMVREVNVHEKDYVIMAQQDQIENLATSMMALEGEKMTLLKLREEELLLHQKKLLHMQAAKSALADHSLQQEMVANNLEAELVHRAMKEALARPVRHPPTPPEPLTTPAPTPMPVHARAPVTSNTTTDINSDFTTVKSAVRDDFNYVLSSEDGWEGSIRRHERALETARVKIRTRLERAA